MHLAGFGIGGYRGFGEDVQRFWPLGQLNAIIGRNSSGKSTALEFIAEKLAFVDGALRGTANPDFHAHDNHRPSCRSRFEIAVSRDLIAEKLHEEAGGRMDQLVGEILSLPELTHDTDAIWFPIASGSLSGSWEIIPRELIDQLNQPRFQDVWFHLQDRFTGKNTGIQNAIRESLREVYKRAFPGPAPRLRIEDLRNVGTPLVDELARLQRPNALQPHLKQRWAALTAFVRGVLEDPTVSINIPAAEPEIEVHTDRVELPLNRRGRGEQEVIIMAARLTEATGSLVCIEEPELHLHPRLQRKLLEYLATSTDHQYVLSTHSAHILDHPDMVNHHVWVDDEGSIRATSLGTNDQRVMALRNLGYRPSDLLQSNFVIWVEGPSDRLYVNHWLAAVDPTLKEGLHYTVMWYGGALRSNLAGVEDAAEGVPLPFLARHSAIVIDSDRKEEGAAVLANKTRLMGEFEQRGQVVWLTDGREIENYIPPAVLDEAVDAERRGLTLPQNRGPFDDALAYLRGGKPAGLNKLEVAMRVVAVEADLGWHPELRRRVEQLAAAIRGLSS